MIRLASALFILLLFFLFQAATCSDPSSGQTPAQTLAAAKEALDAGDFSRAQALAKIADGEPQLRPWARIVSGTAYERANDRKSAASMFRSVSEDLPASLDARVGLLRIGAGEKSAEGASLSELEQSLQQAGRRDLVDELQLIRGEIAERSNDLGLASSLYLGVRKRNPSRELTAAARSALWRVQAKLEQSSPEASLGTLTADASLLLREGEPRIGLERLRVAQRILKPNTRAAFEALLIEEQLQRALGKVDEADRILATVGADGDPASAEEALTRIIKNAWNKNDDARTLEFLARFRERFGAERNADELRFIEARTYEARGDQERADKLYGEIAERGKNLSFRVKSVRQRAWGAFHAKNFEEAARFFRLGVDVTKRALDDATEAVTSRYSGSGSIEEADDNRARVKTVRDLLDDYLHHVYWLGVVLTEKRDPQAGTLFRTVLDTAPRSYYASLAAARLGERLPLAGASSEQEEGCIVRFSPAELSRMSSLEGAALRDWGQAEADWLIGKRLTNVERARLELALSGGAPISKEQFAMLMARAELSQRYGHPDRGVILAESLFKRPELIRPFAFDIADCNATLTRLAFPVPFHELFRRAAEKEQIPLSLVLAQARTESFFNPEARSLKDARGLLQLLESTARLEGMPDGADLFRPELNIELGAKHIASLLKKFGGSPALAASAYNAGAQATERWVSRRSPNDMNVWVEAISYPETRDYVKKVLFAKAAYETILR